MYRVIPHVRIIIYLCGLQIRQVPVRVRVENEPVQYGGRAEHGNSGEPARGPAQQVAAVRLPARAPGDDGSRPHASPRPTVVGGGPRPAPQSPAATAAPSPAAAAPSSAAAAAAAALRQRAGRRRSVPPLGRRHHRQQQTPSRHGTGQTAAVVVVVVAPARQSDATAGPTPAAAAAYGRCRIVATVQRPPATTAGVPIGHHDGRCGASSAGGWRPQQQTER